MKKLNKSWKQGHSIVQGPAEELKNYMHQQRERRGKKSATVVHSELYIMPKMCVLS